MISRAFGEKDINLLGYTAIRDVTPKGELNFSLYRATATAGLEKVDASFAYLKSSCTLDDVARATHGLSGDKRIYVIKPKSMRFSDNALRKAFGQTVSVYVHEDLLWEQVRAVFGSYIESLEGAPAEKYYVKPEAADRAIGSGLSDVLLSYLTGQDRTSDGKMVVVCANAGIGKTTLARFLVHQLRRQIEKYRTIPVFVEAQHWGRLQIDSLDNLWEIIENSVRTFDHEFRLPEDLFRHALRQGYIAFVFDGFDELCGRKISNFVPSDILDDLSKVAAESSARILITTRTLYWNAEVPSPPMNAILYEVEGFNTQQAKGYFDKYFSAAPEFRGRAMGIYKSLLKSANKPREEGGARSQFVNLPLCVAMVAEYVRNGGKELSAASSRQLIEKLLTDICQREVERKQLKTKAGDQLRAFQEIAMLDSSRTNPEFELEMLEAAGIADQDIRKMIDHPMLDRLSENRFRLSFDFLAPYLRALFIAESLETRSGAIGENVKVLMRQEANGKGFMLEHLLILLDDYALDIVSNIHARMEGRDSEAKSFLFHLAQGMVEKDSVIVTARERADRLFSAMDSKYGKERCVYGLSVFGTIDNLDLKGVTIESSRFFDVAFRRCKANGSTIFRRCAFSGELTIDCASSDLAGWSEVALENCDLAFPASAVWESIVKTGIVGREEQVMDALRVGLGKFWYHGRPKLSIHSAHWNKGILQHLNIGGELLESMLRYGLVGRIAIGGVHEGGFAFDKDSLVDLQRFMDNQQLTGKVKKVYESLKDRR